MKQKDRKRNEAKRKIFGSKTKRKYALLISLWLEAKNSKRKEAKRSEKKNNIFSRERAKRMRNGSRFASFRFEAKIFFLRNRRTLSRTYSYVFNVPICSVPCWWTAGVPHLYAKTAIKPPALRGLAELSQLSSSLHLLWLVQFWVRII